MDNPVSIVRWLFVGALIVLAAVMLGAASLASWLVERRRAGRVGIARTRSTTNPRSPAALDRRSPERARRAA